MKRSIRYLGWTLGSAALITVGLGCSRNRPAEEPTGTSSPPFESNVPGPGTPPPPPVPGQEQPPLPPGHEAAPPPPAGQPPPPPTEMGAPPPTAPPATEQPGAMGAGESEHQLCDTLANDAKLRVEDVQHGAAIVAVPRTGHDVSAIRDDAHHLETAMHQRAHETGPGPESCGLFSIARLPGVNVSITEGKNAMRLVFTTSNPAEVKDLRRIARDQVTSMNRAPGRPR